MNGIKLNSIEGLMVEKRIIDCDCDEGEGCKYFAPDIEDIKHDELITEQGNREITMDREVLAKKMADDDTLWEQADDEFRDYWRDRADGVIKCQDQIIKAVKEEL